MQLLRKSSSLNLHSHSRENIVEYTKAGLAFHKEMGFDAADFGMGNLDLAGDGWREQVEQILAASADTGIRIEVCHLPFLNGNPQKNAALLQAFGEKMHRAIDAAAALGVDCAVLHPTAPMLPMKSYSRVGQYDFVMGHLAPFAEHAARVGLTLAVENMRIVPTVGSSHRYCQSPDELCEVADALGIGICWDFGHANTVGFKQSEALSYVGKRLKVLHVNDNDGIEDEHLAPFMGMVDWRDAMHGLALAGFDGLLNYEVGAGRIPGAMRRTFAQYLAEAADALASYIE